MKSFLLDDNMPGKDCGFEFSLLEESHEWSSSVWETAATPAGSNTEEGLEKQHSWKCQRELLKEHCRGTEIQEFYYKFCLNLGLSMKYANTGRPSRKMGLAEQQPKLKTLSMTDWFHCGSRQSILITVENSGQNSKATKSWGERGN